MTKLDEIFRKRLDRIREELNTYIDSHLTSAEHKLFTPLQDTIREETIREDHKRGGVQEKFLNYMKLDASEEDTAESDYLEDAHLAADESCKPQTPRRKSSPKPPKLPQPDVHKRLATSSANATKGGSAPKTPQFCQSPAQSSHSPQSFDKHLNLDKVLEQKEESFSEMLLRLIDEKGLKDSDVYKRANIDRRLFSKIRGDEDYVPSKKTAISFCLALQLEMDEAKKLLATAGYTLSASSRFDLIIMYLIENCEYNIHFANIVLDDYGEGTLSR